MIKKIENVNWLGQHTIFEHDQFFDNMGHRSEGSKEHEYRYDDQNCIWYFVKKSQFRLLSTSRLCLIQTSKPLQPVSGLRCMFP